MKEVILPAIEKEVNEGKNFAQLRQIYSSLILAVWFKQKLKTQITQIKTADYTDNILQKAYVDKKKIQGVDSADPKVKEKVYSLYLEAYKNGLYNYIKKDFDPYEKKQIKRRYYSGGFDGTGANSAITPLPISQMSGSALSNSSSLSVRLRPVAFSALEQKKTVSSAAAKEEGIHPVIKKIRSDFEDMWEKLGSFSAMKQTLFEVRLEKLGIVVEDLGEIFERYDEDYGTVVIKDEVMSLLSEFIGMPTGVAFNFVGTVVITESTLQKAKEGDKDALFFIKHEQRHNDYRDIHGNSQRYSIEQNLVNELYAHFSSFIDIYGVEALNQTRTTKIAKGPWWWIVTKTLIKDYIDGFYRDKIDTKTRDVLRIKMVIAANFIHVVIEKNGPKFALEYLKSATGLNMWSFPSYELFQAAISFWNRYLGTGAQTAPVVVSKEENMRLDKGGMTNLKKNMNAKHQHLPVKVFLLWEVSNPSASPQTP